MITFLVELFFSFPFFLTFLFSFINSHLWTRLLCVSPGKSNGSLEIFEILFFFLFNPDFERFSWNAWVAVFGWSPQILFIIMINGSYVCMYIIVYVLSLKPFTKHCSIACRVTSLMPQLIPFLARYPKITIGAQCELTVEWNGRTYRRKDGWTYRVFI